MNKTKVVKIQLIQNKVFANRIQKKQAQSISIQSSGVEGVNKIMNACLKQQNYYQIMLGTKTIMKWLDA